MYQPSLGMRQEESLFPKHAPQISSAEPAQFFLPLRVPANRALALRASLLLLLLDAAAVVAAAPAASAAAPVGFAADEFVPVAFVYLAVIPAVPWRFYELWGAAAAQVHLLLQLPVRSRRVMHSSGFEGALLLWRLLRAAAASAAAASARLGEQRQRMLLAEAVAAAAVQRQLQLLGAKREVKPRNS